MKRILVIWLLCALTISGCATSAPVAVTCPPSDPVPAVLKQSPSTGPTLSEQFNSLLQEFRNSLTKATKPE